MPECIYELRFTNFGPDCEDENRIRDSSYLELLSSLPIVFKNRSYKSKYWNIDVSIDWQPVIQNEVTYLTACKTFDYGSKEFESALSAYMRPAITTAKVNYSFLSDKPLSKDASPGLHELIHYLYECFLISNLSCPGSMNLLYLNVYDKNKLQETIKLSHHCFEFSWLDSIKLKWPLIDYINLQEVNDWYIQTGMQCSTIAKSNVELALISLLHTSLDDSVSPSSIMWLAHGLEAIFDTAPGESFGSIVRRASILLNLDSSTSSNLKKQYREFYNVRSAFVHGGFKTAHPWPIADTSDEYSEYFDSTIRPISFAFMLLVCSLQTMIRNNWIRLSFSESISGT